MISSPDRDPEALSTGSRTACGICHAHSNRALPADLYFYSVCYVVIFGLLYPLLFIGNISNISLVLSFVIFIGLYAYMIYDVLKKSKGFKSAVFSLFVVLVILAISFSIVKIFI